MAEYPEFSELYQDTFTQHRLDKEIDRDRVMRVHARFERIADPDNLTGRVKDDEFDKPVTISDEENDMETSDIDEWDDMAVQELYKRFKILK
jgi:hypothetical protein